MPTEDANEVRPLISWALKSFELSEPKIITSTTAASNGPNHLLRSSAST
jgi:hypothetical protein